MSTFQARVQDLVGTQADTAALTDWLTEGARVVVDALADKRSDKLELYATAKTYSGSGGVDVTGGRVISAHKAGYPAQRVPAEMYAETVDADSIHYGLATDPSWYILETKGYVQPSGGTLRWVAYPSVLFSASTISNFPPEAYPAVAYYAAIQSLYRDTTDLIKTTLAGITYSAPTFGGSYTNITTHLTNQDIELAKGEADKLSLQLNEYGADIQLEIQRIQALISQHQATYAGYFKQIENLEKEYNRIMATL